MLVALPSAIAYGVTIFSPLGAQYAAAGAVAGMLGAIALGLVAPSFGGTNRLITAPCAPAAAVMSAFALEAMRKGTPPHTVLLLLMLVPLLCGLVQIVFGAVGLGRLIKYMPYPVVSGYLSGVGLIIIGSQIPKLLGVGKGTPFWQSLISPSTWQWQGLIVGLVTMAAMLLAPKVTKAVPAAILGLVGGSVAYFGLGLLDKRLLTLADNHLVVGPLQSAGGASIRSLTERWAAFGSVGLAELEYLVIPALTLAVLLSIDTLKTCVILDALTRSRHDSNRELLGQGLGNIASALVGGTPGSGTMGATLVNITSGGRTRLSAVIEGAMVLVAFVALGKLIAWVPLAALAGILIVIGVRMFDLDSLHLLKVRSTVLDFAVIVAVVVTALTVGLIAASAVGIALAVMLFIRQQISGSVVRRKTLGNQVFSKQARLPAERAVLEQKGEQTVIFELQSSLFFGTTDQLHTELEPELKQRRYFVLDMRRVQSVDVTAAHLLEQIEQQLREDGRYLLFSHMPRYVPSGQDMKRYLDQLGLVRPEHHVGVFGHLDEALEWVEDQILAEERLERETEKLLELRDMELLKGRKEETLAALEARMETRSYKAGEVIFKRGDRGSELFLIRRGAVRILLPTKARDDAHHLATFGRGDFVGEVAFLDGNPRSASAVALTDSELFVISRENFDRLAEEHKKLAIALLEGLAMALADRLRRTNIELRAIKDA